MPRHYGIDLGTTNTVVCKFESLKTLEYTKLSEIPICYPEELSHGCYNVDGKYSLPSLLYLEASGGKKKEFKHYVGEVAEQLSTINNDNNLFINTKRLMSKTDDLGHGIRAKDVARDLYNICFYSIAHNNMRGTIPASQKFCVTRPAAYNPFATVATIDVAKEFGYMDICSLEEPKAALLNYLYELLESPESAKKLFEKQEANGGFLIFGIIDIGGGTTDVTIQRFTISGQRNIEGEDFATGYIITLHNEEIDGKQSMSNPYEVFGGLDFDREAAKYIIQKIDTELAKQGLTTTGNLSANQQENIRSAAMHEAKNFKEHMDGKHEAICDMEIELLNTTHTIQVKWTEEEYNQWVACLCKSDEQNIFNIQNLSIHSIVENTLGRSNYKVEELDCFFVTGGMSNYVPLRTMLREEYSEKVKIIFSENPLTDIARGAALYNAYFQVKVPVVTLNEGIMIDNPCGEPIVLAPSGHRLPYKDIVTDKLVITNPIELHIDILSGIHPFDSNMRLIKRLWARKLVPTKMGTPVDIHFEITDELRINIFFDVKQKEYSYSIPIDAEQYDIKVN